MADFARILEEELEEAIEVKNNSRSPDTLGIAAKIPHRGCMWHRDKACLVCTQRNKMWSH